MTALFSFNGASDDLVEVDTPGGPDEFSSIKGHWVGLLRSPDDKSVLVVARFEHVGCWSMALCQTDENEPVPQWIYTLDSAPDCEYSVRLRVEAPDGTTLTEVSS